MRTLEEQALAMAAAIESVEAPNGNLIRLMQKELREAETRAEQRVRARIGQDSERLDAVRKAMGYVENGSHVTVTISQDDATRDFIIRFGKKWTYGAAFRQALDRLKEEAEKDAERKNT